MIENKFVRVTGRSPGLPPSFHEVQDELRDLISGSVAENPSKAAADENSRFLVAFGQDARSLSSLAAIQSLVTPPDQFSLGTNAAYPLCRAGFMESKTATTRNWAGVLKPWSSLVFPPLQHYDRAADFAAVAMSLADFFRSVRTSLRVLISCWACC